MFKEDLLLLLDNDENDADVVLKDRLSDPLVHSTCLLDSEVVSEGGAIILPPHPLHSLTIINTRIQRMLNFIATFLLNVF